jgi:UDP-N-acetylmuramoyl-tripeptide--D-alanyl-D-alanine ligase
MLSKKVYQYFKEYPCISTDSRKIRKNSVFFALKGDNFDGNQYAEDALNKGAVYAVVDNPDVIKNDKQYILVKDVLKTLQEIAAIHRTNHQIPVIAITGTNGKTTTKNLTTAVLKEKFNVLSPKKNLNNHIGVPLTLLELKPEHNIAVIEMGANHQGEIDLLCKIAQPTHGMITNIGKAHLEGFGSFEGVYNTKTELYRYLEKVKGTIFYNKDNSLLTETVMSLHCNTYSYGTTDNCDLKISSYQTNPFVNLNIESHKNKDNNIKSKLIGLYNLENIMAAIAVGAHFNIPFEAIRNAIERYVPNQNRSQIVKTKSNYIILDAYNANPTSMKMAIENFSLQEGDDKVLILGDMFELGKYAKEEHQNILDFAAENHFTNVYLIGTHFSNIYNKQYKSFKSTEDFIEWLKENPIKQKSILIKGSRGMELEQVAEFL